MRWPSLGQRLRGGPGLAFGQKRLSAGARVAGRSTCVLGRVEGPRKLGFAPKMETAGLISRGALFQPQAPLS